MGMAPSPPAAQRLVTKQQYDQAIAGFSSNFKAGPFEGQDYQSTLQKFKDTMSVLPPPAPDLSDEMVQRARAARKRLLLGGMSGVFDLSGASVAKPPPGLTGV